MIVSTGVPMFVTVTTAGVGGKELDDYEEPGYE